MKPVLAAVAAALLSAAPAWAATELQWWHAMTGANNDVVNKLADEFNKSQPDFKVVPTYKGGYPDTMNAGIAAFRASNAPHILQVFEVGTATMMAAKGAVKPVYQLMKDAGEPFDPKAYLPAVTGYYSTAKGDMLSLPFNSSSMVMWINKDALAKANIDHASLRTWPGVFEAAKKLRATSNPTCGFSTAWITWGMIEQFSAWHNVPIGTKANGLDGFDTKLEFNTPLHEKLLHDAGRSAEGQDLRLFRPHQYRRGPLHLRRMRDLPDLVGLLRQRQRQCEIRLCEHADALLSRRDGRAAEFDHRRRVAVGDGRQDAPTNTRASRNSSPSSPTPIGRSRCMRSPATCRSRKAAYDKTKASGFYDKMPILETPLKELTNKEPTENSRGLRFGNMVQIRDVWAEEIEEALAGKKTAKAALDAAVERGNAMLRQFERTAGGSRFEATGDSARRSPRAIEADSGPSKREFRRVNGKARRLLGQAAALSADRAAARDHAGVLLLARFAGAEAKLLSSKTRSAFRPISSASRTTQPVRRRLLFPRDGHDAGLCRDRDRRVACRSRSCWRSRPIATSAAPASTARCSSGPMRSRRSSPACSGPSCFSRRSACSSHVIAKFGVDWNPLLNGSQAMTLVIVAATWKQISYNFLFFLAGLQAIPKSLIEAAAIDGARPFRRFLHDHLSAALADDLLPRRRQHRLRLLRHVRHHRCDHRRRAGEGDGDAGLQSLSGRPARRRSRRLGRAIGDPDDHRHRADERPVPLCRAEGDVLMRSLAVVENRRFGNLPSHLVLLTGVAIVAFPVYVAIIASTQDAATIANGQLGLMPGPHAVENYRRALFEGAAQTSKSPVGRMMLNSFISADRHRHRQDRDFDAVGLCDRLFPLSVPHGGVLADLPHADAAGRGAHLSDLRGRGEPRPARFLRGPRVAADRLGDGDFAVPPVLHDRAGRIARSREDRRRRPVPLLPRYSLSAVAHEYRGAVRHSLHLRLEPVSVAAAHHHAQPTWRRSRSASARSSRPTTR